MPAARRFRYSERRAPRQPPLTISRPLPFFSDELAPSKKSRAALRRLRRHGLRQHEGLVLAGRIAALPAAHDGSATQLAPDDAVAARVAREAPRRRLRRERPADSVTRGRRSSNACAHATPGWG